MVSLIYMKILQELKSGRIKLICHMLQSFYKLKQAEKLWNKQIVKFFLNLGFVATNRNLCILFYKDFTNDIIIIVDIYVNNIIIVLNYNKTKDEIKT